MYPWLRLVSALVLGGVLALVSADRTAQARVFLAPNGAALPGELGWLLGGAQVALASGAESLYVNPAGLALETDAGLTVGGSLLRLRALAAGSGSADTAEVAPGSAAYAAALGDRPRYPRFAVGLGLALTQDARWPLVLDDTRQGTAASLPPGTNGAGIDATFPDGLAVRETGDALGELRVLAPALGLGVAPVDWFRVGAALHLERVSFAQRATRTTTYRADDGAKDLNGQSQLAWVAAGESLRLVPALGLQLRVTRGVVLGLALRLPSQTREGSGRRHYQRADDFEDGSTNPGSGTVFIARDSVPFRLETPRRVRLGLAFRSDRFLIELDLYEHAALDPYTVLPGATSQPPSTTSFALPPLRTRRAAVLGWALGMAWAQTARTSLLLGLAGDPAPVPPDDPVFRSLDFYTVSAGVYHVRGDLSGSLGVQWREGQQNGVPFTPPDGGQPLALDLAVRELSVRAGGSVAF